MVDRLNRTRKRNLEEARSNLNEIDGPRLKAECETGVSVIFQHERKGGRHPGEKAVFLRGVSVLRQRNSSTR